MVSFGDIAIFVLATTRFNGKKQAYPTYLESRIIPIKNTWGALFPNIFFVFGSNVFDYKHLLTKCHLNQPNTRKLVAHTAQTPSENISLYYTCGIGSDYQYPWLVSDHFNVMWTGNCTGEYFGSGPTCRFQESLRSFMYNPKLANTDWFIFMDDDIYLRPFAFLSFLATLHYDKKLQPVAVVGGSSYRGFRFSKAWKQVGMNVDCLAKDVHDFAVAQPLILNRFVVWRYRHLCLSLRNNVC